MTLFSDTAHQTTATTVIQNGPPRVGMLAYRLEGADLVFVSANDAASEILSVDCMQFVGQTIEEAFPPLAETEVPTMYRRAAREGIPWTTEHVSYDDGVIRGVYEVHAFQTAPDHMAAVFLDITERKQAAAEREQMNNQMQHMQKLESLGVLAGGIAHDFNNLLCGILGSAELILLDIDSSHPAHDDVDTIRSTARKASELCKQLLAYSGKGRFVIEPLNVSDIITGMDNLLRLSMAKTVVFQCNLSDNLLPIDADPGQIQQIILNLAINASEAIENKSGVVRLTTGMCTYDRKALNEMLLGDSIEPGTYVYVEVSDTGCGMSEDTVKRMFDPFFSTKFTGRGLGLAATLGILRSHGGAITVDSNPGQGSTITVCFPPSAKSAPNNCPLPSPDHWQGRGCALLVDDEDTVRVVGKRVLETLGFDVLTAEDGRVGVQTFKANTDNISLVLLDMTMPHLDGAETFHEIHAIAPDVPVLLISGYDEDEAIARFTEKGLAGFIHKPFTIASMRDAVRKAIEG